MGTIRHFSGAREGHKGGAASDLKRLEIQKGDKLPLTNQDRYKIMLDKKLAEQHSKLSGVSKSGFSLKGTFTQQKKMSLKAEQALQQIAQRKAAKEEKKLRQMVVIQPRHYGNLGYIDAKGNVYDEANNLTLKVDGKTGKIKSVNGWSIGKYKPKSMLHEGMMKTAILQNSPYHIRLRQLELQRQVALMYEMQNGGLATVYGSAGSVSVVNVHGSDETLDGSRRNLGVGAWGVMSSNVHGTFGENVHGGFADNIWGGANTNIWGGIDAPSGWGRPGKNIWNSGKPWQKNYIGLGFGMLKSFFGLGGRTNLRPGGNRPSGGRK